MQFAFSPPVGVFVITVEVVLYKAGLVSSHNDQPSIKHLCLLIYTSGSLMVCIYAPLAQLALIINVALFTGYLFSPTAKAVHIHV